MITKAWFLLFVFVMISSSLFAPEVFGQSRGDKITSLTIHPIGRIVKEDGRTFIVLDKKYEPGLLGMDRLSSVTVMYWFDRNDFPAKRSILQVHPRGDKNNPLTGVFATRSPVRPNLIGVSRCKIISVKKNIIEVEEIDAFSGSPVIDLKN